MFLFKRTIRDELYGTSPGTGGSFERHVVSPSLPLKTVVRPQNLVVTSLARVEGGVARDQAETVPHQLLEA